MFIDFSIKDLIDILLVAYLLYQTYRLMKDSGSSISSSVSWYL